MLLKPGRLRRGDVVGLLSPSSEIQSFPRRTERALQALTAAGFVPRLAAHARARTGHTAGTPAERAADFHALLDDPEVTAIVCTTGGYNANGMLPLLDYDRIRANPKIVCGYSDPTALLCAIQAKTSLCTFYGPTLLPTFGEAGGPPAFSLAQFIRVTGHVDGTLPLVAPAETTDEYLHWERDDVRPRTMRAAEPWTGVVEGLAEGALVGGNLATFVRLTGTPYRPVTRDAILCFEEAGGDAAQVEAHLHHLEQAGVLAGIRGLVFARPSRFSAVETQRLHEVLARFAQGHGVPALAGVDFGHTEPRLTIPFGVRARLDAGAASLTLLEGAVTEAS